MELLARYRNLVVLLVLLIAQIIGLALQVRRTDTGRMTLDSKDGSGVRLIRLWANAVVSPPERAVQSSRNGVGGFWENYLDLRHVRQQNRDLQQTIDRLRLEQAAMLEDTRQGQRLQAMLKFQQKYVAKTVAAQIIGSSGSDQSRVYSIDKGKDYNLARDMAVITAEGIVGKVREVFPHSAQVLAINDQTSGAGVILETTRIRGILRGDAAGHLQVVGILADQRIKPGEKVLTAGGDEIFPRGLPVGEISKIETDPDRGAFILITLKPAAPLDRLDEVLIIVETAPEFTDQQKKDVATSEDQKGAEAAELAEKRKASEIMAERLPGLTDPGAPGTAPAAMPGQAATPGTTPAAPVVPKVLPPQHSDRFTPGHGEDQPDSSAPGTHSAAATQSVAPPKAPTTKPGDQKAVPPSTAKPKPVQPPAPKPQEKQ